MNYIYRIMESIFNFVIDNNETNINYFNNFLKEIENFSKENLFRIFMNDNYIFNKTKLSIIFALEKMINPDDSENYIEKFRMLENYNCLNLTSFFGLKEEILNLSLKIIDGLSKKINYFNKNRLICEVDAILKLEFFQNKNNPMSDEYKKDLSKKIKNIIKNNLEKIHLNNNIVYGVNQNIIFLNELSNHYIYEYYLIEKKNIIKIQKIILKQLNYLLEIDKGDNFNYYSINALLIFENFLKCKSNEILLKENNLFCKQLILIFMQMIKNLINIKRDQNYNYNLLKNTKLLIKKYYKYNFIKIMEENNLINEYNNLLKSSINNFLENSNIQCNLFEFLEIYSKISKSNLYKILKTDNELKKKFDNYGKNLVESINNKIKNKSKYVTNTDRVVYNIQSNHKSIYNQVILEYILEQKESTN